MTFKIIKASNFNDETLAESVYLVLSEEALAYKIAKALNDNDGDNAIYYYKVVREEYKLWNGMEDLI